MKKYIIIGSILGFCGIVYLGLTEWRKIKQEDTKKTAIENPEVKESEVIHEKIVEVVSSEGTTTTTTERTSGRIRETKVVLPEVLKTIWSVSAGYGYIFEEQKESWYAGVGRRVTENIWAEVVYHTYGSNQAVTVGLRYEF